MRFDFALNEAIDVARQRCLDVIKALGWRIRRDMTQEDRIACYVPIKELLPNAPVYFISLYSQAEGETVVVLTAAGDTISSSHARDDLPILRAAILTSEIPAVGAAPQAGRESSEPRVPSQARCFISYRRYDSADATGRIYDRLVEAYGADRIFKDVDDIPLGTDFRRVLDEAVGDCAVLLVVIGRDWLTVTNEQGQRRIDDSSDFVRIEIESALRRAIPVIPVLVRDAAMPRAEDLPGAIADLVYRNGIQIRSDPDFHRDMDRLIHALADILGAG